MHNIDVKLLQRANRLSRDAETVTADYSAALLKTENSINQVLQSIGNAVVHGEAIEIGLEEDEFNLLKQVVVFESQVVGIPLSVVNFRDMIRILEI